MKSGELLLAGAALTMAGLSAACVKNDSFQGTDCIPQPNDRAIWDCPLPDRRTTRVIAFKKFDVTGKGTYSVTSETSKGEKPITTEEKTVMDVSAVECTIRIIFPQELDRTAPDNVLINCPPDWKAPSPTPALSPSPSPREATPSPKASPRRSSSR